MYRFHTKSFCIVTIWHQTLSYRIVLETLYNVTFSHQIIEEKCLSQKGWKADTDTDTDTVILVFH